MRLQQRKGCKNLFYYVFFCMFKRLLYLFTTTFRRFSKKSPRMAFATFFVAYRLQQRKGCKSLRFSFLLRRFCPSKYCQHVFDKLAEQNFSMRIAAPTLWAQKKSIGNSDGFFVCVVRYYLPSLERASCTATMIRAEDCVAPANLADSVPTVCPSFVADAT